MYEVLLDGKSLYYPGDAINAVTEAKITETLNDSGYMDILVPPTNPLYDCIYERKSEIEVRKDSSVIWKGEVVDISENMKKEKKLYVVGDMSYLNDSVQEKKEYLHKTVIQILGELVNEHNRQVESRKHFVVGVVTIDIPEGTMNLETNYESTLYVIREKICKEYNGYIRIRWVGEVRYLDIVKIEDYGNTCQQPIQFGRNLLNYAKNLSAGNVVTCVVPLGKEVEDGTFLTIKSVNGGLSYVFNQEAVNSFGWIRRTVKFSDITDAQELLEAGCKWLSENQYAKLTIEVNAVDLSLLKAKMDSFNLGDYVNAKAKPFGLDAWYYIRKKVTDLLHPDKNTITIGDTISKSYTQQMQQEVGNIEKEIPSASKILLAAKQNASNLIKAATTGFIVLNPDENGNPKELLVMDTPDIETAKKIWRLNINGFGYSSTGYDGEYGTAITMDGAIVADFITAGTMYADRIKGGTLTLGGADNNNGVLSILNEKGKEVGRWDNSGITLPPGTTISWTQITDNGNVASKGDIPTDNKELSNGAGYTTRIDVNNIITGTVTAQFVDSLKIKAGSVDAENITGTYIKGKTIEGGTVEGTSIEGGTIKGTLIEGGTVKGTSIEGGEIEIGSYFSVNSSGEVVANSLSSKDAQITGGTIGGFTIDNKSIKSGKSSLVDTRIGVYIGTDGISVGNGFRVDYDGDVTLGTVTDLKIGGSLDVYYNYSYRTRIEQNKIIFGSGNPTPQIKVGDEVLINLTVSTVSLNNSAIIGGSSGKVGFFSNAGSTKKSVSTITSTSNASASTNATKINEIINALKAYNLI